MELEGGRERERKRKRERERERERERAVACYFLVTDNLGLVSHELFPVILERGLLSCFWKTITRYDNITYVHTSYD